MASSPEQRVNEKIRAREVRVIGPKGEQLGIKPLPEAISLARGLELDLVEVADRETPPVCRIMDFGKHRYETAQKNKQSRKKATNVVVKEMKYRPKIGVGDFETKTRRVEKFLLAGHKVKITIMFRGREVSHPDLGRKILDDIAKRCDDFAMIEVYPRLDGKNMTMVLGPESKKGKKRKRTESNALAKKAEAAAESSATTASEPAAAASPAAAAEPTTATAPPEATAVS